MERAKPLIYKSYIALTKPGIIFGNLVTMTAGFGLSKDFSLLLFALTALGLSLVIASACVWNNIIDRHHDGKMERTKDRPLVTKALTVPQAALFGLILLLLGIWMLAVYTNVLATTIALIGWFIYVIPYSFLKYRTVHATLIGSIAGAVPPLVGTCAVQNKIDLAGLIFFVLIVVWQMPHFFAIALYRLEDYRNAEVPILPIKRGLMATKVQMVCYIALFWILSCTLTLFSIKGLVYLALAGSIGLCWLILALLGFKAHNDRLWARKMFLFSLIAVMAISGAVFL